MHHAYICHMCAAHTLTCIVVYTCNEFDATDFVNHPASAEKRGRRAFRLTRTRTDDDVRFKTASVVEKRVSLTVKIANEQRDDKMYIYMVLKLRSLSSFKSKKFHETSRAISAIFTSR